MKFCIAHLRPAAACIAVALVILPRTAAAAEKIDTALVSRIRAEEMLHSQVMDLLSRLVDVHGGRLTGSPQFNAAAAWASDTLRAWGLTDVHLEAWGPFGKAWSLERYTAQVLLPQVFPLISFPKAWSPGTNGTVRGDAIYFDPANDSALQTFRGKLKGKFVLISEPRVLEPKFKPRATRETDQSLLDLANADFPTPGRHRPEPTPEQKERRRKADLLDYAAMEMCKKEGVLAVLTASWGDGGNVFVQGANVPSHPDTSSSGRYRSFERKAPEILPQIAVGGEHYNRLCRLLAMGIRVQMEIRLDVESEPADSSYNVIAEIPGTDLKDEVVMLGAHLDSWHGGTGTTDNGTGVATCMEAVRIIKALGLQPRRTIRIGLWSGEEQGLFGSRSYVTRHLGEKTMSKDSTDVIRLTPEGERFSVYFNNDNGTGKVRGVYMQGNEAVRPIFRSWLTPFEKDGAATLTLANTWGTDHQSFDAIGLPAFQFLQDDIEYFTLTWHSTMDVYERAIEEDLKQTSMILATFAYNAAMRDEKFPRKPAAATGQEE
jgi:carboxypeptidase Q